jgi:hypothetical protein
MKRFGFTAPAFDLVGIGALDPVVSVRLDYRIGDSPRTHLGSGFFLDVWPNAFATAAHVLLLPDGATSVRLSVTIFGGNRSITGLARSMAYPDATAGAADVGVVRLPMDRPQPQQQLGMHTGPLPPDGFLARVVGRPSGVRQEVPIHGSFDTISGLIGYVPSNAGADGMSGGPVRTDTAIVGIHLGLVAGMGGNGAAPVDDVLLSQLVLAAAAAE